jgi:hypothetical protein
MIWLPSIRRTWLITGAGALLILVGGGFLLSRAIETALYTAAGAYLSNRTMVLYQTDDTKGIVVTIPHLSLSLLRRRMELTDVRIRFDKKDGDRYVRFEAVAPEILLTGLDLSDAIWHSRFHLSGVKLREPRIIRYDEGPEVADSTRAREDQEEEDEAEFYRAATGGSQEPSTLIPAPDSLLYRVVAAWLPDEIRGGRIERISVEDATLSSRVVRGKKVTTDSTAGLNLQIRGIQLDSAERRVFEWGTLTVGSFVHATPGYGDSVRVEGATLTIAEGDTAFIARHAWIAPEGPRHALHAMGIARSQARQSLTIDSLRYAPPVDDTTYFRIARPRSTSYRLAAFNIRFRGVDQAEVQRRELTPATLTIDSIDLAVIADQRAPAGPPKVRRLWPQRLDALEWVAGIDSIILKAGDIRYGEIKPGQTRPGVVRFSNLKGTVANATNDSTRSGAAAPVVIEAQASLFNAGPLKAKIEVVVAPGPIELRAEARLGAMPISAFNSFVLAANGINITDGQVHEADVWFKVQHGLATGQLRPRYENFNLELVDKVTKRQSLGKKLKSIVAGIMTRSSNMPNKKTGELKAVVIRYEVLPTETFWGLLWHAARAGVVKAIRE